MDILIFPPVVIFIIFKNFLTKNCFNIFFLFLDEKKFLDNCSKKNCDLLFNTCFKLN